MTVEFLISHDFSMRRHAIAAFTHYPPSRITRIGMKNNIWVGQGFL